MEGIMEDEDEEVILQGSAFHKHLSELGYSDFEVIPTNKSLPKQQNIFSYMNPLPYLESISKRLYSIYTWFIQEETVCKQQITTVINSKVLLGDHAQIIHTSLEKYPSKSWGSAFHSFIIATSIVISSACALLFKNFRTFNTLYVSSSLLTITYIKHSRICAAKDLETVIHLQNDSFDLCKSGLKILRYGYRIPLNRRRNGVQFFALSADKLQCFQQIMENLIQFMEHVSHIHYKVSLMLKKLIPQDVLHVDAITIFDSKSFSLQGEITYQELKELYNIYILTQSELLYVLTVAYDRDSWKNSSLTLPEEKLAYIVHNLIKYLIIYKSNLSTIIETYYKIRAERTIPMHTGKISQKWSDLYVHLHLTSNKLQLAYNHILSILEDIDNDLKDTDDESIEEIMQKLNEAYKDIVAARNFTEFTSLLVAKTRMSNRGRASPELNPAEVDTNPEPVTIIDSEPIIVDEVFEEYIKEEYLKPLYEEGAESSVEDFKWDKYLAKSFLVELKDALIDKKKSMSERESKALQRMYKNVMKDIGSKKLVNHNTDVPPPPPMPDYPLINETPEDSNTDEDDDLFLRKRRTKSSYNNRDYGRESMNDNLEEETRMISFIPLPKLNTEEQIKQRPISLPPAFLKVEEETFMGSGEISEEETAEDEAVVHENVSENK